ncbi:MAG TPA: hypothetical protein VFG91_07170 [Woeseiaceae bacterium]|nr:hypothetical protein [Woeseiaceae bacterium]
MNRRASDDSHTTGAGSESQAMLEEGRQQAREAGREAANIGREQLQAGAGRAADGVGDFAEALGSAATRLNELHHEGLADYANRLSSQLSDVSGRLRDKNVDELAGDVRRLAERNPALFLLGSVAIGIGLSRFAKASREKRRADGAGGEMRWSESRTAGEPAMADYTTRERVFADGATERPSTGRSERPTTPDSTGGTGL